MGISYEQGLAQLFQAPLERFVAERKRISAELKATGDKAGAARLLHLARPPVSAWVVNQLWWQEQGAIEELFATAARQRAGERAAVGAHRQQLAALRARAAELLVTAGHAATETTLRRVTMTLAALAAAGQFEPDSPGALSSDRDPPGFEAAFGEAPGEASAEEDEAPKAKPEAHEAKTAAREAKSSEVREGKRDEAKRREEAVEREAAKRREATEREQAKRREEAAERERRRVEAERAQRRAERERLKATLQDARKALDNEERAVAERREALQAAEQALERARVAAEEAEGRLQAFADEE
jgi:hypothetical protein